MGVKWRAAAWEVHETSRLSAKFSSCDPQAGGKNKLCRSCGVTATLATKNHKALYSLLRDQEVACSLKPAQKLQTLAARSRPGGPVPVARSPWLGWRSQPGPVPWPRLGGPVPVARSRWPGSGWPGPGGPVPWPGPGAALRAPARGPARKKTYSEGGGVAGGVRSKI